MHIMYHTTPSSYYYGDEANQYTFYRLPKALFTSDRFKTLSDGAKILYGLMLDRMGLSVKNEWLDEGGRVFIIFTLEEAMEYMNCSHDKAVKMFAALDMIKGVGLIERVKQGQGKPALIYVKKFLEAPEVKTSEIPKSRLRKIRSQDCGKTDASNNNINNTEFNNSADDVDDARVRENEPPQNSRKQPAAELPPEKKGTEDTPHHAVPELPTMPPELTAAVRRETARLFSAHTDRRPAQPDIDRVAARICGYDNLADTPRCTSAG
jgi:hypothetical protein